MLPEPALPKSALESIDSEKISATKHADSAIVGHVEIMPAVFVRRKALRFSALRTWQRGEFSFAHFDAAVQDWINHVRYTDSWGLRQHALNRFDLGG
jgi:hypothetical protein